MDEPIKVENKKQNRQKPPLSLGRIAGEILVGIGMGFAVTMLVGVAGIVLFHGTTRIAFRAMFSKITPGVYGIASAVGVYLLGSKGDETGSFLPTLGLGFVGGLVMLVIPVPSLRQLLEGEKTVLSVLVLLVPQITATIGFNLTRRYKDSRKAMDESITATNKKQNLQRPPLSVGRIASEILAGTALGFVALPVVYLINIMIFGKSDYSGSVGGLHAFAFLGIFMFFFPPLYILGSAVGVSLVGDRGDQTGSFLATLGGALLGLIVIPLLWPLVFLAVPIMAALGFNLTRRYKEPPSS